MATLTSYRGLQVVAPDPAGDGGLAIQDDLKSLVDWSPKSVWAQSADPTVNEDETDDFFPGSLWLRTDTSPPKLFVCQSSAAGAAVWRSLLLQVVQDAAPKLGGDLDVNGKKVVTTGNGNVVVEPAGSGYLDVKSSANIGNALGEFLQVGNNAYTSSGPTQGINPAIYVYKNGKVSYGIKLQRTGSQYGTTIFGPNEANRFISFNKVSSSSAPVNDTDFGVEFMRIDLDTGYVGVGTADPTSLFQVAGAIATAITTKSAAYTLTAGDSVVLADANGGAFTLTLPTAVGIAGRQYTVKRVNAAANNVTIGTTSSQTIDGVTTKVLSSQYEKVTIVSDGANWLIV